MITRKQAISFIEAIKSMRENATDEQASMSANVYPTMKYDNSLINANTRILWQGQIKKASVDLWDIEQNNPTNAPSLWEDIQYKEGYRIIPTVITVGTAFAKDECGWWNEVLYKSLIDNNTWTPTDYPQGWEEVE